MVSEKVSKDIELYNVVEDGEKKLKWLSPCPAVNWAGELKRDRSFLINTNSNLFLQVTIFNPEGSKGKTLRDMEISERLKSVNLLYRRVGSVVWRKGQSKTEDNNYLDMNFVHKSDNLPLVEEDNYGYASMKWHVGDGLISDGTYEIVVESKCSDVGKFAIGLSIFFNFSR